MFLKQTWCLLILAILEAGLTAELDGFDAVCIDTMSDSGVAALRSSLSIPVVGPGRVLYVDGDDAWPTVFNNYHVAKMATSL